MSTLDVSRSAALARPSTISRRRSPLPYLLMFPTLIFVLAFTVWPTISAILQSTMRLEPGDKVAHFVGLGNFVDLFNNNLEIGQTFPLVFVNTLLFVGVTVPVSIILAFLLALLLNRKMKATPFFRVAFFYPVLLPMIGAASIFAFIFADQIGLANTVLFSLHIPTPKWIGADLALTTVMIVVIWKQVGFYMIIYLAGLQNLPEDVFEAARLDGATAWTEIRHIVWPLLSATTLFVLTTAVANAFQTVDQLYALGQGNPNDHSNLLLYMIYQRINDPHYTGFVNAITVILLAILLTFTVVSFIYSERRVYYASN